MRGIKRIAIVGAGPTGIACARYLKAENTFDRIDIFEQRGNVGGIWNLSEPVASKQIPIPQTNPSYGEGGVGDQKCDENHDSRPRIEHETSLEFESPLYDYLETNIPKTMMAFSDHPFDAGLPLYPGHADVLKYLQDDAASVWPFIQFQTQVVSIQVCQSAQQSPNGPPLTHKWEVTTKSLSQAVTKSAVYDAVVVANGHYTVPHVPDIPGLALWNQRYPNTVIHSKAYRRPEDFRNKRVVVVGNSASGLDIAGQMAPYVRQPLYLISRSASQLAPSGGRPQWREDIAEIDEFLVDDNHHRAIQSKDGKIINDIDTVIFATGYFYSFPFVSSLEGSTASMSPGGTQSNPSTNSATPDQSDGEHEESTSALSQITSSLRHLTTSGLRTHDVYKHFLHIDYPTLALPVLNLKIVPFPLAENQAAVIARLWSGRLDMPSNAEMRQWQVDEQQRLVDAGRLRPALNPAPGHKFMDSSDKRSYSPSYEGGFHTLVYPEDADQMNSLYSWAASARRQAGLENDGDGKLGTRWNEFQVWLRGQFPNIKAAYTQRGEGRTSVTSLDKLGEDWAHAFEKWKQSTSTEDQRKLFIAAATPGWV